MFTFLHAFFCRHINLLFGFWLDLWFSCLYWHNRNMIFGYLVGNVTSFPHPCPALVLTCLLFYPLIVIHLPPRFLLPSCHPGTQAYRPIYFFTYAFIHCFYVELIPLLTLSMLNVTYCHLILLRWMGIWFLSSHGGVLPEICPPRWKSTRLRWFVEVVKVSTFHQYQWHTRSSCKSCE